LKYKTTRPKQDKKQQIFYSYRDAKLTNNPQFMTKIVQIGGCGVKIIIKKAPDSIAKRGNINYLD